MDTSISAILGLVFLGLGTAAVFLMYKLWGYPFDHETRTSSAPKSLMLIHRAGEWYVISIEAMPAPLSPIRNVRDWIR